MTKEQHMCIIAGTAVQCMMEKNQTRRFRSKINSEQTAEESKHERSKNRDSEQDDEDSKHEYSKNRDSEHGGESIYERSKNKDSELDEAESESHKVEKREESKVLAKRQEVEKIMTKMINQYQGRRGSSHSYREMIEAGETRGVKE